MKRRLTAPSRRHRGLSAVLLCLFAALAVWTARPALAGAASTTPALGSNPALWRASLGTAQFYLFGSVHLGRADLYPLPARVDAAFAMADTLVVEVDLLSLQPRRAEQLILERGFYAAGEGDLEAGVSAATWQRLLDHVAVDGLPLHELRRHRPWLAAIKLSTRAANRAGFRENLGIDRYFLRLAEGVKPIVALESMTAQLNLFAQLSAVDQENMLRETLRDLDQGEDYFEQLFAAWRSGDEAALQVLLERSLSAPQLRRLRQLLLGDRNWRMAAGIMRLVDAGKTPFVVVGAAHLVGDDGLVQLFIDRGLHLERL